MFLSDLCPRAFHEIGAVLSFCQASINFFPKLSIDGLGNVHSSLSNVNKPFVLLSKRSNIKKKQI